MKIHQVSDSVYVVAGTNVNWALISNGSGTTLIDAGYPADTDDLLDSIRQIGHHLEDVTAVLLTHAHLDHIGAIPTLVERIGMPVYTGTEEVRHAKREYLQQITPVEMLKQLASRRGRRWSPRPSQPREGESRQQCPQRLPPWPRCSPNCRVG
ncbi:MULTISPECIES: MBL fold metallo-hydrolase [Mycobacterium]|uniref:MBL fold metallo-hydrolase n=1 Tax=Mycobacterium TaxID=1763 RepID=UPI000ACA9CA6|nr:MULTISPECIES: MBL fold metallo-hydrolase [Mycobacterium]